MTENSISFPKGKIEQEQSRNSEVTQKLLSKFLKFQKKQAQVTSLYKRLKSFYGRNLFFFEKIRKPLIKDTLKKKVKKRHRKRKKALWKRKILFGKYIRNSKRKRHLKRYKPRRCRRIHRAFVPSKSISQRYSTEFLNLFNVLNITSSHRSLIKRQLVINYEERFSKRKFKRVSDFYKLRKKFRRAKVKKRKKVYKIFKEKRKKIARLVALRIKVLFLAKSLQYRYKTIQRSKQSRVERILTFMARGLN